MFKNMKISTKTIAIALAGPAITALIMGYLQVSSIKDEAQDAILKKSRAIVQLAEASREQMNHKLNEGILMPFDKILPAAKMSQVVPRKDGRLTKFTVHLKLSVHSDQPKRERSQL